MRTWIVSVVAALGMFSTLVYMDDFTTFQIADSGVYLLADEGSGNGPIGDNGGFEWG